MARGRTPDALTRFLTHEVPRTLRLSNGWMAAPAEHASHFEVTPSVLLPNVSLATPALIEAARHAEGATLLACPEDLEAYQPVPVVSVDTPGAGAWYAAGARALVPVRSGTGAALALWVLGAPLSGDLFEPEDLAAFERIAAQAGLQLERQTVRAPVQAEAKPSFVEPAVLTAREQQVLGLLAHGYSNRQIADELIIGVRTVETHVDRILRKLDLDNRAQAVAWVHQNSVSR